MVVVEISKSATARKRIGSVDFSNGKLHFFAGYHECDLCGNRGKILLSPDESREFGKALGLVNSKQKLGVKITKALMSRYELN